MDYPFENLGPEKFQLFCQALLVRENPNMQCFPVGQPDGGRDIVQWQFVGGSNFIVFQVKFSRAPVAEKDPHKWLLDIVKKEAPKVKKLIPAGAKQYVLMTNVPGTAHLGVGSIDTTNAVISKELGIPGTCLWRNDLNRRLDSAWDLKWAYPELMTGPDLIRLVIENGLTEAKERRASAIRAFVTYQHSLDKEVKFKQVELQNKLLDLFIDVPLERGSRFSEARVERFRTRRLFFARHAVHPSLAPIDEIEEALIMQPAGGTWSSYIGSQQPRALGTATFILSPNFGQAAHRVVIEGAPGQGKSTITQYVCQVHRMTLLEKQNELLAVPQQHKAGAVRLPIRVDLRDFASWLGRENPFTPEGGEIPIKEWNKSLESLLAALIRYQSGGAVFDVSDLHAVSRLSALLIVFDGLDEVADIKKRQEVVDEITKGIERLDSNAASLQVVVTSRPAAFANSPGFSEELFNYFDLAAVTPELIDEYATKWLKARDLQGQEAAEVRRILKEKLDQPHLRDLARNPMQLAILLSLIHTRGTSLPDKRTALYDSYIELFFNREAEKSPVVRDNRELLINIHRYLAWLLHSEAELGSEHEAGRRNGAIASDRLIAVLREYLSREGHDPDLADTLFKGMVERVVALVSRVEGTYEFEVQPLREYFAARFLYETAPYSPTGAEKYGTKPDRFDAIARDFYWLNVTRFYAGCYSKGELASLIDSLRELVKDKHFRLLSHPRVLGGILLSDWVFSQYPRSVRDVVSLVLDGIGLRYILASSSRRGGSSTAVTLSLPKSCGRTELISRCQSLLYKSPPLDFALDIIDLLKANASTPELMQLWLGDPRRNNRGEWLSWLQNGLHLGCLSLVDAKVLSKVCEQRPVPPEILNTLFRGRRAAMFEATNEDFIAARDGILALQVKEPLNRPESILDMFAQSVNGLRYAISYAAPQAAPLASTWTARAGWPVSGLSTDVSIPPLEAVKDCVTFIEIAIERSQRPAVDWATKLDPWDSVVEQGRAMWGERLVFYHLANVASGIKSATETSSRYSDPFNAAHALVQRARYARLRAGVASWWPKQISRTSTAEEQIFLLMLWATWGSGATLCDSCEPFDAAIEALSPDEWHLLYDCIEETTRWTGNQSGVRKLKFNLRNFPRAISSRTVSLFKLRANPQSDQELHEKYLVSYKGDDVRILGAIQDTIIRSLHAASDWKQRLALISRAFRNGVISEPYAYRMFVRHPQRASIPLDVATKIMRCTEQYPSFLVASAEACCKQDTATKLTPVAKVAQRNNWFVE